MYHLIRRSAYQPDGAAAELWRPELYVLPLTGELGEVLKGFYKSCRSRRTEYSLPVRSLNGLLQAAAPGVLAIGRGATTDESVPWLYARDQVPGEVIRALLNTWVMGWVPAKREQGLGAQLEDALAAIGGAFPEWGRETVDLFKESVSPGGTGIPDRRLFSLLPEQVALHLAGSTFGREPRALDFRVVSTEQGAEVVSWPPLSFPHKGHVWRYSATLKITAQTIPLTELFRIHVTSGIRRWVTQMPVDLRGRSATVLFDVPSPWDDKAERIRLVRNAIVYDKKNEAFVWTKNSPAGVLPTFDLVRAYPEAGQLMEEPARWLAGEGGVAAGLVYRPGIAQCRSVKN